MAVYEFRCRAHGVFEVRRPMGQARRDEACPTCGDPGARVYAAPALGLGDPRARAAIARAERSREQPDVVAAPPPAPRRRPPTAPADPRLRRLPRP